VAPLSPAALRRALEYPYAIPDHSYVFDPSSSTAERLVGPVSDDVWRDRLPILSIGSNASPEQLARKFPPDTEDATPIVALRARLRDHDVVYAARVSRYGPVPATMVGSPGTEADVHVTLLTEHQRAVMDRSEALGYGYDLEPVPVDLVDVDLPIESDLVAYVAEAGPLRIDGAPIALAAVPARVRRYRAWTELEVLEHVAARCRLTVPEWVARVTSGRDALDAMRAQLEEWSRATPPDPAASLSEPGDPSRRRPG